MEYQELLRKFFSEEISDDEVKQLRIWLASNPENRRVFDRENEIWNAVANKTKMDSLKIESDWVNISSRLGIGKNDFKTFTILRKNTLRIFIAAASVACLMAIGAISLWLSGKEAYSKIATASVICSTSEGEKAHITLCDSTKIFMNSTSALEYNGDYNVRDRIVRLKGEAYFDVSTNPEKPFIVQTDQMTISATGTRFNILNFDSEDRIEATLEEGTITVSVKGKEPLQVKSGQQIVYLKRAGKVEVREISPDVYTSWRENKLRLNDTPFEESLRKIARKYNVKFELTNRDLLKLSYSATFIDESIEEVMEMLQTVSPISYKIYYLTKENDKKYLKPKIVVGLKNPLV
jgi:transmembrane sensor